MRRKSPSDKALDAVLRGLDFVPAEQRHEVLANAKRILDRERKRAARAQAAADPAQGSLLDANES